MHEEIVQIKALFYHPVSLWGHYSLSPFLASLLSQVLNDLLNGFHFLNARAHRTETTTETAMVYGKWSCTTVVSRPRGYGGVL